jgi:acyl carrier protein
MVNSAMDTVKLILINLGIAEQLITESAFLYKDLELDSTETVEIALELKRRFNIDMKFESRADMPLSEICSTIDRALAEPT